MALYELCSIIIIIIIIIIITIINPDDLANMSCFGRKNDVTWCTTGTNPLTDEQTDKLTD